VTDPTTYTEAIAQLTPFQRAIAEAFIAAGPGARIIWQSNRKGGRFAIQRAIELHHQEKENHMSEPMQTLVHEFHETYGVPTRTSPGLVDEPTAQLRINLMIEELLGSTKADGSDSRVPSKSDELVQSIMDGNIVGIADGIADLLYVVVGTADVFGIDIQPIFEHVHASNMSKLGEDGKPILREDGKVLKGPNYFSAEAGICKLLENQRGAA